MLLLITGILLFIGLVVAHEWGHFIMARRNGVVVEEFGIFFPPRLLKRKMKGGWNFTINLLPLGGFVKLKGEHDSDTTKGSFGAASLLAKTKIMAAGVVVNLLIALILLTALAWLGMPKLIDNQFTVKSDTKVTQSEVIATIVDSGSPAAKAGLRSTDQLVAIGLPGHLQSLHDATTLPKLTKEFAGQTVQIQYRHQGNLRTTTTKLLSATAVAASIKAGHQKGYLGIVPQAFTLSRSTWSAPVVAVGLAGQMTGLTFEGLGRAVAGVGSIAAGGLTHNTTARQNGQTTASSQVSGPVGIFIVLQDGSLLGYQFMLLIIAVISLTLGIMNILPVPALDGGRLWITLIAHAIKKPLTARREELINASGFAFLLALIAVITFVDIKRFF